jgi:hypothetical protein
MASKRARNRTRFFFRRPGIRDFSNFSGLNLPKPQERCSDKECAVISGASVATTVMGQQSFHISSYLTRVHISFGSSDAAMKVEQCLDASRALFKRAQSRNVCARWSIDPARVTTRYRRCNEE